MSENKIIQLERYIERAVRRLQTTDNCAEYFGRIGDRFILDMHSLRVLSITNTNGVKHEKAIVEIVDAEHKPIMKDGKRAMMYAEFFFPDDNLIKLIQKK